MRNPTRTHATPAAPATLRGHQQGELARRPVSTWESRQSRLSKAVRGPVAQRGLTNAVAKRH